MTGEDFQQILKLIASEMRKLKRWFDSNESSLHLSKTKIMFENCKSNNQVQVRIDV